MNGIVLHRQSGVGLVEVMVSITIGLFILAGVLQLYATTSTNAVLVEGSSRIQENARYVMARLENDIKQAGYAGCFNMKSAYKRQYFSEAANDYIDVEPRIEIISGASETETETETEPLPVGIADFQFIDGADDQAVGSSSSSSGAAFDNLTVRYFSAQNRQAVTGLSVSRGSTSTTTVTADDLSKFKNGAMAAIGDCSRFTVFTISNDPDETNSIQFVGEPGRDYQVAETASGTGAGVERSVAYVYGGDTGETRYSIGNSTAAGTANACTSASPQYCALFRNGDELIEGVEEFQIEYGWKDSDGNLYFNQASEMTDARWYFTDRVRVILTLNSIDRAPMNDGSERLTRQYSRIFLIQNQLPGDASRIAGGA